MIKRKLTLEQRIARLEKLINEKTGITGSSNSDELESLLVRVYTLLENTAKACKDVAKFCNRNRISTTAEWNKLANEIDNKSSSAMSIAENTDSVAANLAAFSVGWRYN